MSSRKYICSKVQIRKLNVRVELIVKLPIIHRMADII